MIPYQVKIPPDVEEIIRHFPPLLKRKIRLALEELSRDPQLGKPLKAPLEGFWSYRVGNFRVIYRIHKKQIQIEVIDISERKIVYEKLAQLLVQ